LLDRKFDTSVCLGLPRFASVCLGLPIMGAGGTPSAHGAPKPSLNVESGDIDSGDGRVRITPPVSFGLDPFCAPHGQLDHEMPVEIQA